MKSSSQHSGEQSTKLRPRYFAEGETSLAGGRGRRSSVAQIGREKMLGAAF